MTCGGTGCAARRCSRTLSRWVTCWVFSAMTQAQPGTVLAQDSASGETGVGSATSDTPAHRGCDQRQPRTPGTLLVSAARKQAIGAELLQPITTELGQQYLKSQVLQHGGEAVRERLG